MRFAATSFRPIFGRILSVVVAAIALLGLGGFVVTGDWIGLVRYAWGLLLIVAVAFALFWFPSLDVAAHEITVRNVFSTVHVPWPSIQRIDTKYALTLFTDKGKVTSWASPAPNRYAAHNAASGDARVAAGATLGMAVRPGDLLSTASGAAAFVIRRHWDDLREDGLLDGPNDPGAFSRDIHWPTITVLAVLIVATVVGTIL